MNGLKNRSDHVEVNILPYSLNGTEFLIMPFEVYIIEIENWSKPEIDKFTDLGQFWNQPIPTSSETINTYSYLKKPFQKSIWPPSVFEGSALPIPEARRVPKPLGHLATLIF